MFHHTKINCMNYFQHFFIASKCSFILFRGSIYAILHAFYPDILITCIQDTTIEVNHILNQSGCK